MSESEHKEILNKLRKEYVGKFVYYDNEFIKIIDVYVDYRYEAQHMNRIVDEYGNTHFINELKEAFIV